MCKYGITFPIRIVTVYFDSIKYENLVQVQTFKVNLFKGQRKMIN